MSASKGGEVRGRGALNLAVVVSGYPGKSEFFETSLEGIVFQQNGINGRVKPLIEAPLLSLGCSQEGFEALLKVCDFWGRDALVFTFGRSGEKGDKQNNVVWITHELNKLERSEPGSYSFFGVFCSGKRIEREREGKVREKEIEFSLGCDKKSRKDCHKPSWPSPPLDLLEVTLRRTRADAGVEWKSIS